MAEEQTPKVPGWELLIGGVLFTAGAVFIWFYLSNLEKTPGPHRIHWLLAWLYNTGGKGLCVTVVGIPGALMLFAAVWKMLRGSPKRERTSKDEDDEYEE
ncbi:MAG: hypothetical protein L0Y72_08900 [Gemmataceae bacterium]|nr:hypothetical protein [Gemmataceae bacterium]MCI0739148.1 hypothetical protein [Gemmataceae bacterium]